jgi:hypothetical protein
MKKNYNNAILRFNRKKGVWTMELPNQVWHELGIERLC